MRAEVATAPVLTGTSLELCLLAGLSALGATKLGENPMCGQA